MRATTTVHPVSNAGPALDNSKLSSVHAQTEIQNYLNENASSLTASQPTGTATTTAPAELCGQQVAGLVDGPNGQIFLVDTTDQTGSRRITALDPATCVILAQLTVG